ncbi:MAG: UDP-N-acetylmuramoyl-tripeptide--D-alanyl-D-alanine ligase, partial [Robiginitalea sp.]|uniref:UDP-N-acetylmuramoyl-tripeptide--D-alanyl-D- alanine ligase n=1 Tax=Robiginitalea sp. TaxID=1902411 RepID=UPI003C759BA9
MNIEEIYSRFLEYPSISTDSRNILPNSLFFALKGPNFNGNRYAAEALDKGAAFAVVDEAQYAVNDRTLIVPDVLKCLQDLATHHRRQSKATLIALTGSNGKTTTKELISRVLERTYKTQATVGNLNNHIGVALTLLQIRKDTEMMVVEMGANHQKEIAFLCALAEPDFGYITNYGKAHLEGFGGVEGVIRGKSEMYDYLIGEGKTIFLNADDPIQRKKLESYVNKVGFSTSDSGYLHIENQGADPFVTLRAEDTVIETSLSGAYNFSNCAIAVLIGKYFNVPLHEIRKAIESYVPENNRSQLLRKGSLDILLDAYNANPSSMSAALEHLEALEAPKKFAVLGDMFELGADSTSEHQQIAEQAKALDLDTLILVGTAFSQTTVDAHRFKTFEALVEFLKSNPISGPGT